MNAYLTVGKSPTPAEGARGFPRCLSLRTRRNRPIADITAHRSNLAWYAEVAMPRVFKTAGDILDAKGHEIIGVQRDSSIRSAIALICHSKVGATVVKDGADIIGIWTERDLLHHVLDESFSLDSPIEQAMSSQPDSVGTGATLIELMDKYLSLRIRHLLVTDAGEIVGLLSIGDVTKATLQNKARELEDATEELASIKEIVNLAYYQNRR